MGIPDSLRTLFEFRDQTTDERARFVVYADTYDDAVEAVKRMVTLSETTIRQMLYSAYQRPMPATATGCGCAHE